jgi:hypothetical protein
MPLAWSRTAFPWVARGGPAAVLALLLAVLVLLMPARPLPWLAAGLALAVGAAAFLAGVWRSSSTPSAPASGFVGS